MQHIRGRQVDGDALHGRSVLGAGGVLVVEPALGVPVHHHAVWHQRIEGDDLALAVADDLGVGVAPQEQMGHERFPEYEGTHLRVRLIVEKIIERMVQRLFLAAILLVAVEVQRQTRHRFRQDADAGVHGGHLHGGTLVDVLAGGGAAEEESCTRCRMSGSGACRGI